jgi:hypothetical protein
MRMATLGFAPQPAVACGAKRIDDLLTRFPARMAGVDRNQFVSMQMRAPASMAVGRSVVSPAMNPVIESLSKRQLVKVAAFIGLP